MSRVERHDAFRHISDISATRQKLHHLFALPRELGPPRFGGWVLFQPTQGISVKLKIYLSQTVALRAPDGISRTFEFDEV